MKKLISVLGVVVLALSMATAFAKSENKDIPDGYIPFSQRMQAKMQQEQKVVARKIAVDSTKMPIVAVMYQNESKTTYNDDIDAILLPALAECINADTYKYVDGAPFIERLSKAGIVDITTAERQDIIDALEGENIDYVVYMKLEEFTRKDKMTFFTVGKEMTANVPFKIIDVKNNKYVYNGRFAEMGKKSKGFGGVGNKSTALKAIKMVAEKVKAVVEERLPKTK